MPPDASAPTYCWHSSYEMLCMHMFFFFFLQHGLKILGHGERRFRLALDLIDRNTVRNLDEGQPVCKVDVEHSLKIHNVSHVMNVTWCWVRETHQFSNDSRHTCTSSQGECTLLDNLRVALLVGVLHCHNHLGL